MDIPTSAGLWWFRGQYKANGEPSNWRPLGTTLINVWSVDHGGLCFVRGRHGVRFRQLRGQWERAVLPSWEAAKYKDGEYGLNLLACNPGDRGV